MAARVGKLREAYDAQNNESAAGVAAELLEQHCDRQILSGGTTASATINSSPSARRNVLFLD